MTSSVPSVLLEYIKAVYDLIRLPSCVMASAAAFIAGMVALMADHRYPTVLDGLLDLNPETSLWPLAIRGIWIPFLIVAGSMALNDWKDYDIDRLNNRTDRPLVRGDISRRTVLYSSILTFFVGLVVCFFVFLDNPLVFLAAVFFSIISVAYSIYLKKTGFLGNVIVGLCFTAPFILGAAAARVGQVGMTTILLMSAVILVISLGREILKGVQDLPGDRENNVKTLANLIGPRSAAATTLILFLFGAALSVVLIQFARDVFHRIGYVILMFIADISLVIMGAILLKTSTPEMAKRLRGPSRYTFWIGLLAFAVHTLP